MFSPKYHKLHSGQMLHYVFIIEINQSLVYRPLAGESDKHAKNTSNWWAVRDGVWNNSWKSRSIASFYIHWYNRPFCRARISSIVKRFCQPQKLTDRAIPFDWLWFGCKKSINSIPTSMNAARLCVPPNRTNTVPSAHESPWMAVSFALHRFNQRTQAAQQKRPLTMILRSEKTKTEYSH